ncbi:hypothetical protein F5Y18DRAFT_134690 [Xylariaceae sp. FL1019]|nr:hypothetical protein F5Y18DRAFT_134690 [Xylariaceae sp. FL1019]
MHRFLFWRTKPSCANQSTARRLHIRKIQNIRPQAHMHAAGKNQPLPFQTDAHSLACMHYAPCTLYAPSPLLLLVLVRNPLPPFCRLSSRSLSSLSSLSAACCRSIKSMTCWSRSHVVCKQNGMRRMSRGSHKPRRPGRCRRCLANLTPSNVHKQVYLYRQTYSKWHPIGTSCCSIPFRWPIVSAAVAKRTCKQNYKTCHNSCARTRP